MVNGNGLVHRVRVFGPDIWSADRPARSHINKERIHARLPPFLAGAPLITIQRRVRRQVGQDCGQSVVA